MSDDPFDHIAHWDPLVEVINLADSAWRRRGGDDRWPAVDIVRISASRPWQLEASTEALPRYISYPGRVRQLLVESVLVPEHSAACVEYATRSGQFDAVAVINPQRGQGYAHDYAVRKLVSAPYMLKWDDDMVPVRAVPLSLSVALMERHAQVNQICYNKRQTVPRKPFWSDEWEPWWAAVRAGADPNDVPTPAQTHGRPVTFVKKERAFAWPIGENPSASSSVYLTVKDKWWFGPALWRMAFVRPIWTYLDGAFHNFWNDKVVYKLIDPDWDGSPWPPGVQAEAVERAVGCYIWGRIGDEAVVRHAGHGDSIWKGEYQARMAAEGRTVIGVQGD